MSEFDNLKDKAEGYAKQHPEQVKEGEEAVEKKFGLGQQDQASQSQASQSQGGQGQGGQGQGGQQGHSDQGQQAQQPGS